MARDETGPPEPPAGADPARDMLGPGMAGRLTRGAGLAGLGFVLTRGLTFATYIVLAQLIEPSDAGELAAGMVLIGAGFVLAESGMLAALIHWKEDVDEAASTATVSTVVTGVLLTLFGLATAPLVGAFFQSETIGWVAAATSGLMLLRSIQIVPDALLARRFAFVRRITIDPLGALLHAIVSIVACANGMGVWGLVLGNYALYGSQALAGWLLLRWRPKRELVSFAMWRRLASYARHVLASEIIRRFTIQLDSILLGRFAGAGTLGQYGYGLRIATTPTDAWVSVASFALLPAFARIADDTARFRRALLEAAGVMCTLSLPIAVLLFTAGDQLALFAFGPEWPQAGDAIRALCALAVGQTLTSISSETFKAGGQPWLLTRTHALTTALSIVALPSLMIAFANDAVGIGIAVSAVSVVTGLYAITKATRLVGSSPGELLRGLAGTGVAALIALAAVWALDAVVFEAPSSRVDAGVQAALEGVAMALVYGAAVRVAAPAQFARIARAVKQLRRR